MRLRDKVAFVTVGTTAIGLVILSYALFRWNTCKKAASIQCGGARSARDVANSLRTGDIVSFCFDARKVNLPILVAGMAMGTCFYHVGMVVEQNGTKYIMHYLAPKDSALATAERMCPVPGPGPVLSVLEDALRVAASSNTVLYISRASNGFSWTSGDIINLAMSMACGNDYDTGMFVSYIIKKYSPEATDSVHCNTFIGTLLERMGVLSKSPHPIRDYVPGKLQKRIHSEAVGYASNPECMMLENEAR